jgi:hypothetical protein
MVASIVQSDPVGEKQQRDYYPKQKLAAHTSDRSTHFNQRRKAVRKAKTLSEENNDEEYNLWAAAVSYLKRRDIFACVIASLQQAYHTSYYYY